MARVLRALIIEDSEADTELLLRELRRSGYDVEYERVETAEAMQALLLEKTWDLILSDYSMPRFSALQALEVLRASRLDLPFIIISGTIGEDTAVSALKAGANDFLVKGKFARLLPAVERELREAGSRRERKQAEETLREKERLLFEAQRIGQIGSWSYDILTDRLYFSDEMYRLFDVAPAEFTPDREGLLGLIYSLDRAKLAAWMEEITKGRPVRELDIRVFHKNSELRYIRCRGAIKFDLEGKPSLFIGTAQDITERKLAEIQIRQQLERLTALRKIDQAIISSRNLRSTMAVVLSQVVSQLQIDAADILLMNPEQDILEYAAGRGFRSKLVEATRIRPGQGHAGRAASEGRLIQIENLEQHPDDPVRAGLLGGEDFVSYMGVPLIFKDREKGVLEIFHRAPLHPYPDWLDFLNTLAGQAAIAIENAQLFENLQESNRELFQAYDATIEGWSRALDLRDRETEGHTRRVTEMMLRLARAFGLPEEQLVHIRRGALLHDIGKMGVPDHILLKPGELTKDEWARMRTHPQYAYDLLKPIHFLTPALDIPYAHHEKWDGSGYPRGLKGVEIPLAARLFAVVDVWDALRSDRPYRSAWSETEVREYIRAQSGRHFDPRAVEQFLSMVEK